MLTRLTGTTAEVEGDGSERSAARAADAARAGAAAAVDRLPRWLTRAVANPWVHGGVVLAIMIMWSTAAPLNDYNLYVAQLVCVYAIAAMGLNIPAGLGGALSLGQAGAFALGVYSAGILAANHGWPVWGTLPVALLLGFGVGLLMGVPAGRLGAVGLAMVSLGYAMVIGDLILNLDGLTGGVGGLTNIALRFLPNDNAVLGAWVVPTVIFVVMFITYIGHWYYRSSRFGRAALATRDEPIGAAATGISTYRVKLQTFAIGSAVGALAGGLFGYLSLVVTPSSVSPDLSVLFLAMVVLGGAGSRLGPLVGAVILGVVPLWLDQYPHVNTFVYGGLLVGLMLFLRRGIMGGGTPAPLRHAVPDGRLLDPAQLGVAKRMSRGSGAPVLSLRGVSRRFGELLALDGVDFDIRPGEIVGVVGPNGSGKTTLLNIASGMYKPDAGTVQLNGKDVTGMAPHRIVHLGLARTFQTPKTFPGLSIAEHLALAAEHAAAGDDPEAQRRAAGIAMSLLRMGGMDPGDERALRRHVSSLAQGQLRFLEVALSALGVPRVLLLDEPAAGLSASEMEGLESAAQALADSGIAVVIVEHHLDLIRRLVDRVVVLHLGRELWCGPPSELHASEKIRVAYLGIEQ
jgi:branched-chain amino acid transport system permease protein